MIKWRTLSRKEAADLFGQWVEEPVVDCNSEYSDLRTELRTAFVDILDKTSTSVDRTKLGYEFDLEFGLFLYTTLVQRYGFTQRLASDDGIWRFLSLRIVPDLVHVRWGSNPSRFYQTPRRVWLKVIWWYIHLSWQGDKDSTLEVLKHNTTDDIVQLVERPGPHGYRIEFTRALMREYYDVRKRQPVEARLLRRVMVLNTARSRVLEPSLCVGGEAEFVKELFAYFGYREEKVAAGNRSIFGLRWPFARVSERRP